MHYSTNCVTWVTLLTNLYTFTVVCECSDPTTDVSPATAASTAATGNAVIADVPTELPDVVGAEACQTLNA